MHFKKPILSYCLSESEIQFISEKYKFIICIFLKSVIQSCRRYVLVKFENSLELDRLTKRVKEFAFELQCDFQAQKQKQDSDRDNLPSVKWLASANPCSW